MTQLTLSASPTELSFNLASCALLIIDMQRDFLEPGGFGSSLGNDVLQLRKAVEPLQKVLAAARAANLRVIHTREGHRADMTDAHPAKVMRGDPATRIGASGPMGRILIRGEAGHQIIEELAPVAGEVVIDKPGKGAFYQTDLELILTLNAIDTLLVCGVTTEVCVHTTIREANDRGYRCVAIGDCCASYFQEFHDVALRMVAAQGGIFGRVSDSEKLLSTLQSGGSLN